MLVATKRRNTVVKRWVKRRFYPCAVLQLVILYKTIVIKLAGIRGQRVALVKAYVAIAIGKPNLYYRGRIVTCNILKQLNAGICYLWG